MVFYESWIAYYTVEWCFVCGFLSDIFHRQTIQSLRSSIKKVPAMVKPKQALFSMNWLCRRITSFFHCCEILRIFYFLLQQCQINYLLHIANIVKGESFYIIGFNFLNIFSVFFTKNDVGDTSTFSRKDFF